MPSTWLTQKSLRLDNDCVVSEDLQVHLDSMAECAKRTLELAASMGTVVIITNAEQGWIELSCRKFMPSLYDSVTQYRILSARSTFEPEGFQSPFEWKVPTHSTGGAGTGREGGREGHITYNTTQHDTPQHRQEGGRHPPTC